MICKSNILHKHSKRNKSIKFLLMPLTRLQFVLASSSRRNSQSAFSMPIWNNFSTHTELWDLVKRKEQTSLFSTLIDDKFGNKYRTTSETLFSVTINKLKIEFMALKKKTLRNEKALEVTILNSILIEDF